MMSEKNRNQRIVGVDLFSGAGGMTLGATQAGIEVIFAVENCIHAAATYQRNFPKIQMHVGSIQNLRKLPKKPRGATTVVFGGPPCQGFSTSNQRTRNAKNPKNWLFEEFVRLVRDWNPDYIVMENVKGITETDGGKILETVLDELRSAGYQVSFDLLNAVDFGIPQKRTRAFIVGFKKGKCYEFPARLGGKVISVSQAIGDLPPLTNGAKLDTLPYKRKATSNYAKILRNKNSVVTGNIVTKNSDLVISRYPHVSPGGNWQDIPESLFNNYADHTRCHTGIYRRLDAKKPSVVIGNFRKNMLIHPTEDRGLSIREAARIQSIPDEFCFSGSIGFQQQQVGNMVPPPLARAIFSQFFNE